MNPDSFDPPTAILSGQALNEFTIISSVFARHAYQLISMYKMNYRTGIVFLWGGGGGGAQWGAALIREWALIRSFTVY